MTSIGSDPEVFLRDKNTGTVVPACGLFGGTKGSPIPIDGIEEEGYGLQEDNVMLEFNIPPAFSADDFFQSIFRARSKVSDLVRTKYPDLELDTKCVRTFPHDAMQHPQARTFGCAADFDAYEDGDPYLPVNPDSLDTDKGALRFAGGHIHIGYHGKDEVPPYVVARLCDLFIGLRTVNMDKQEDRRSLYGQPGRFRPTPYGIEYRTLSNFWLWLPEYTSDVGAAAWAVGNLIEEYVSQGEEGIDNLREKYTKIPWADVRAAIIDEDENLAKNILAFCYKQLSLGVI